LLAACSSNDGVPVGSYSGGGPSYSGETSTSDDGSDDDAGGIPGEGAASAEPMLAYLDPGATMVQTPGQGVGVFAQYDAGGHWYVWWTCDTAVSNQACEFQIQMSVPSTGGVITNSSAEGFGGNNGLLGADNLAIQDNAITASTITTTAVQGVHFDTEPGTVVTVSAALGGEYSGAFLFFVQDAKVNGGYKGRVTDPLKPEPSSP
jgi:hypothetical protein